MKLLATTSLSFQAGFPACQSVSSTSVTIRTYAGLSADFICRTEISITPASGPAFVRACVIWACSAVRIPESLARFRRAHREKKEAVVPACTDGTAPRHGRRSAHGCKCNMQATRRSSSLSSRAGASMPCHGLSSARGHSTRARPDRSRARPRRRPSACAVAFAPDPAGARAAGSCAAAGGSERANLCACGVPPAAGFAACGALSRAPFSFSLLFSCIAGVKGRRTQLIN